ncbi:peptidoglycan-binding protein, partial [Herbaspirillum sp. HC18]
QLSAKGISEIQRRLQTRGQAIAKIDGKAGMNTRSLIGVYQREHGLDVDCWPSEKVLNHLRTSAKDKSPEKPKAQRRTVGER